MAAILVLFASLFSGTVSADLSDGLLLHYQLEQDAEDASGNGNHGTEYGDPSYVAGHGACCNSVSLDGDDYIEIPSGPDEYTATNEITLAAWVNLDSLPSTGTRASIINAHYDDGTSNDPFHLKILDSGHVFLMIENETSPGSNYVQLTSIGTLTAGAWYHVVATYDSFAASDNVKIYIDGTEDNATDFTADFESYNHPVGLGAQLTSGGSTHSYLTGKLDDVRIYDRALSGTEVADLSELCDEGDRLEAYWSFDIDARDDSGHGHDGVVTDATHITSGQKEGLGAYEFNGTSSYIEIPPICNLDLEEFTVTAWFKPASWPNEAFVLAHGETVPGDIMQYGLRTLTDQTTYRIGGWFEAANDDDYRVYATVTDEVDVWYFAALTRDSAGDLKLYLGNDTQFLGLQDTYASTPPPGAADYPLFIGGHTDDDLVVRSIFDGVIDEVRVYNYALDEPNVCTLLDYDPVAESSAAENCGDGLDNDCDGKTDCVAGAEDPDCDCGYSATANAEASTYAGHSLPASGSFNALALLLVPMGAVIAIRILRRKK
jgi:hypothetical protein